MSRRGVGLVELLTALTLSAVLALLAWSILAVSALRLRERSERIGLTHALRVFAGALRATVEPLGSDTGAVADLAAFNPDGLTARVIRAGGAVCLVIPDAVLVRAGADWWMALRVPVAGRDSLLIGTVADAPRWIAVALEGNPVGSTCPDGTAAIRLPVVLAAPVLAAIGPGSPLRVFEQVEFRRYGSGAGTWAGARLVATGEAVQPFAGPFTTAGVTLTVRRADGSLAGPVSEAALVVVGITGVTERAAGVGVARGSSPRADSIEFSIALRNAR